MKLVNLFEALNKSQKVMLALNSVAPGKWERSTLEFDKTTLSGHKAESKSRTQALEVYDFHDDVYVFATGSAPVGSNRFKSQVHSALFKNGWASTTKHWDESWITWRVGYNNRDEHIFIDYYVIDGESI